MHYDKLVPDPFSFLENFRTQFQLTRTSPAYSGINKIAFPTDWDQDQSHLQLSSAMFDEDYYLQRKYLATMRPEVIVTLEAEIDWSLMRNFGYARGCLSAPDTTLIKH